MAEHKSNGLDRKSLAAIKSKRLEEALSAYTPEQTKETVSKLLEAYTDDGKNYFGAGARDTTLYFADDEYIKEIEKEKAASAQGSEAEDSDKPDEEKNPLVGKLHKLSSFITSGDDGTEAASEEETPRETVKNKEMPISELGKHAEDSEEAAEEEPQTAQSDTPEEVYEKAAAEIEEQTAQALESIARTGSENLNPEQTDINSNIPDENAAAAVKENEDIADEDNVVSEEPENEPTIVIKPVKSDNKKEAVKTEEDTKDMRREFFDNEIEVDEVPRRRRKHTEPQAEAEETKQSEPEPEPETEAEDEYEEDDFEDDFDDDDYDDDDYDDDYEDEDEGKKRKFGGFFSRRKKDDDFFDDDDYYDDDDFDDDYYDDDDYDDDRVFTVGRVINILVIILLICSTAFFAASNYTNSKKLETANTQINELNNGNAAGSSDEQINQLKAQIDSLTAENQRLKAGNTQQTGSTTAQTGSSASQTGTTPSQTGSSAPASTLINGTAPAEESNSSSTSASGSGTTYTIKAGDTGSRICNAVYGQYTPELWDKILAANGMTASTVYHPGDVLQIPAQ